MSSYSKVGFAKLYDRKTALTAADLLNDRVIPNPIDQNRCAQSRRPMDMMRQG